jgi:hypothetical protein
MGAEVAIQRLALTGLGFERITFLVDFSSDDEVHWAATMRRHLKQ